MRPLVIGAKTFVHAAGAVALHDLDHLAIALNIQRAAKLDVRSTMAFISAKIKAACNLL